MRPSLVVAALLLAPPLLAQTRPIAQAPSVLFASAVTAPSSGAPLASDTAFRQDARTVGTGLGVITGSAVVFALSRTLHAGACEDVAPSTCPERSHPGVAGYLVGAAAGGVIGYLIGGALDHRPAP